MSVSDELLSPIETEGVAFQLEDEEIRDILNRLCDDVANADEAFESATIGDLTIKVGFINPLFDIFVLIFR